MLDRIDWNIATRGRRSVAPRAVTGTDALEERITYEPVGVVAHVSAWNYPVLRRSQLDRARAPRRQRGVLQAVGARDAHRTAPRRPDAPIRRPGRRRARDRGRGPYGRGARRRRRRHGVLHRLVRDRPAGGAVASPTGWSACSSSSAARTRRTCATTWIPRRPRSRSPKARSTTAGSRAARPSASTCTSRRRPFVARWSTWSAPTGSATRLDDVTDVGPLARAEQLDVLDAQLADAVQRGARVLVRRSRIDRPGNWFAPTVVVDVPPRSALMSDESFGPVIGVERVRGDAEAVARMNDTEFGLGAVGVHGRPRPSGPVALGPRRGQRLLEHRRPLVRAAPVGRPPALRSRRVDVGVGRPHLRAREGLALAPRRVSPS